MMVEMKRGRLLTRIVIDTGASGMDWLDSPLRYDTIVQVCTYVALNCDHAFWSVISLGKTTRVPRKLHGIEMLRIRAVLGLEQAFQRMVASLLPRQGVTARESLCSTVRVPCGLQYRR
jgi:hypothetical protein